MLEESKRTIVCAPEHEAAVAAAIDRFGLAKHAFKVVASPVVPPGQVIVMDENAMQASTNESLQRHLRRNLWWQW